MERYVFLLFRQNQKYINTILRCEYKLVAIIKIYHPRIFTWISRWAKTSRVSLSFIWFRVFSLFYTCFLFVFVGILTKKTCDRNSLKKIHVSNGLNRVHCPLILNQIRSKNHWYFTRAKRIHDRHESFIYLLLWKKETKTEIHYIKIFWFDWVRHFQ